jgi:(2Fe-2S) ferredoxin
VLVSRSGCLGVCKETETEGEYSPVMVVYPEGVWYRNVTGSGLDEIINSHLKEGKPVEKFLHFSNERG